MQLWDHNVYAVVIIMYMQLCDFINIMIVLYILLIILELIYHTEIVILLHFNCIVFF